MDTPDTTAYMLIGYAVLFGLPLLYVLSWRRRRRNAEKDLEVINALQRERQAPVATGAGAPDIFEKVQ
jgi:hypothetical protein